VTAERGSRAAPGSSAMHGAPGARPRQAAIVAEAGLNDGEPNRAGGRRLRDTRRRPSSSARVRLLPSIPPETARPGSAEHDDGHRERRLTRGEWRAVASVATTASAPFSAQDEYTIAGSTWRMGWCGDVGN